MFPPVIRIVSLLLIVSTGLAHALTVDSLRCDFRDNPAGIDSAQPRLSWIPQAQSRGETVAAYQVQVASSAAALASGGDLWDSGKAVSGENLQIPYNGAPLSSSQQVFWKVRVWNGSGAVSDWSAPASWTMGELDPADWTGQWITAARAWNGYHAGTLTAATGSTKWVQVDLGSAKAITAVRLHPTNYLAMPAYGFPVQFKVEMSNSSTFASGNTTITNQTADYPNPGAAIVSFAASGTARYVRVTVTKFFNAPNNNVGNAYVFSLSQLEVISGGVNVAAGRTVTAADSVERNSTWSTAALTDGVGLVGFPAVTQSDLFRKDFTVGSGLKRAVLNVCGLGQYEASINGAKVGQDFLAPNWSEYRKTCFYDTYDVTAQLQAGSNAIGLILGNGMYNVTAGRYNRFTGSIGPRKAIAQLRLEYGDGSVTTIGTDTSWQWFPGPIVFSCIYGGEDRDARLDPAGWDAPGFNSSSWRTSKLTTGPGGVLRGVSLAAPPVRTQDVFTAVDTRQTSTGITTYDFGQNAAQIPRITVHGPAGSTVKLIPGELINGDGTIKPSVSPSYMIYTLKGTGTETFSPKFYYNGYRYLQVELRNASGGTTGTVAAPVPVLDSIQSMAVYGSSDAVGTFQSSNSLFNRIRSLIGWAQRSNMMTIMTDCPQREKLGWLEEDHLNGPGLRYEYGLSALFTKIMSDIADTQDASGLVRTTAPRYVAQGTVYDTSPEWGSTFLLATWQQYEFDGDTVLIARHYDNMKRYVDYLTSTATNSILPGGLGDWVEVNGRLTPYTLTATAIYYQDAVALANMAAILGKTSDASTYTQLAATIRDAFNTTFYNPSTGNYANNTQTSNAMPLALGIVDPANRASVLNALVSDLVSRNYTFTCGEIGHPYLLRALADNGRSDLVFAMHTRLTNPGYGYILSLGATALTEAWDGSASQNHFMLGHLMNWFYHDLAGIQSDPAGPGFKKIIIKPAMVGDVASNNASYRSGRGTIVSNWTHGPTGLSLNVTIPPASTATVYVPAASAAAVQEGGVPAASAPYVQYLRMENGAAVYAIGSGNYAFTSIDPPQAPTGFSAVGTSGKATLSWSGVVNASSYTVQRSTTNGSGYVTIATGLTDTSFIDSNLTNRVTYYYLVSGVNSTGEGAGSVASATPIIIANAGFEAPLVGTYVYNPAGGSWTFAASSGSNGSGISANGSGFTSTTGAAPEGTQVAFLQGTASIVQAIDGLIPGTAYTLTFSAAQRATNNHGGQTWKITMNGATIASFAPAATATTYTDYTATFTATVATQTLAFVGTNTLGGDNTVFIDNLRLSAPLPAAPTGLTPTFLSESQLRLTWTDNATGETGYIVERSPAGANLWTTLTTSLPSGATSYQDDGLSASTSYDYRVRAIGATDFSTAATVTATTPAGVGDGIPGSWRLQYFGNGLTAAGAAAASADPDRDGMTNLQEYLGGTNPVDPQSVLHMTSFGFNGSNFLVGFQSVAGKSYIVEKTFDLQNWIPVQDNISGTGGIISLGDVGTAGQARAFYRVRLK